MFELVSSETITQDTESVHSRRKTKLDDDLNHLFLQIKLPENDVNVIFFMTKLNGFPKHLLQIILLQDLIWFSYDLLTFMRSHIRLLTGIENKDTTDIDCASVQYKWYHGRSLVNDHRPFGHIFALGSSRSSSMKIGAVANRAAAVG